MCPFWQFWNDASINQWQYSAPILYFFFHFSFQVLFLFIERKLCRLEWIFVCAQVHFSLCSRTAKYRKRKKSTKKHSERINILIALIIFIVRRAVTYRYRDFQINFFSLCFLSRHLKNVLNTQQWLKHFIFPSTSKTTVTWSFSNCLAMRLTHWRLSTKFSWIEKYFFLRNRMIAFGDSIDFFNFEPLVTFLG